MLQKRLNVPSTQKCLAYIERKGCLFSAGIDGAIFAWNMNKLFSNEQNRADSYNYTNDSSTNKDKQAEALRHKKKTEYISYIVEKTPWFICDTIQCLLDLENINQLASGDHGFKIRLWDLRSNQIDAVDINDDKKGKKDKLDVAKQSKKREILQDYFKDQDLQPEIFDEYTKTPCKVLAGHNRAIRELAYSKIHKIIVSVGFDFTVYVWNPYLESYIIKLDEHENPLVGVNCLPA